MFKCVLPVHWGMTESDSHPYPQPLRDLVERRRTLHYEEAEKLGWADDECDSLTDMVDDIPTAFDLGQNVGMMKMAGLMARTAARECTELRFSSLEELDEELKRVYSSTVTATAIDENDAGTATVSLSYSWSDIEDGSVHVYQLDEFVSATALPHRDGYAVDFGPRTDLHSQFIRARDNASDEDIVQLLPNDDQSEDSADC